MNHVVTSSIQAILIRVSMLRYDLFGMGEEPLIIHIHSITDIRLVYWIVMNYVRSDLGKETVDNPSSICCIFQGYGHSALGEEAQRFQLLGVDLCKYYKYNDTCVFSSWQENQPSMSIKGFTSEKSVKFTTSRVPDFAHWCQSMAMERKAQHVDRRDVALDLWNWGRKENWIQLLEEMKVLVWVMMLPIPSSNLQSDYHFQKFEKRFRVFSVTLLLASPPRNWYHAISRRWTGWNLPSPQRKWLYFYWKKLYIP